MTPATGGVRRAELVILNRYYLESDACDPAYRGMGRFLRDMREAGFGALSRDSDLLAVDATTGFTRFNCDLSDYVCTTVARNPQHIFTVEHGFKVIGAHPWARCMQTLKEIGMTLGSTRALVKAAAEGDARLTKLESQCRALSLFDLADKKAQWLRARPETLVVSHDQYRALLQDHILHLRRRAA